MLVTCSHKYLNVLHIWSQSTLNNIRECSKKHITIYEELWPKSALNISVCVNVKLGWFHHTSFRRRVQWSCWSWSKCYGEVERGRERVVQRLLPAPVPGPRAGTKPCTALHRRFQHKRAGEKMEKLIYMKNCGLCFILLTQPFFNYWFVRFQL